MTSAVRKVHQMLAVKRLQLSAWIEFNPAAKIPHPVLKPSNDRRYYGPPIWVENPAPYDPAD